MNYSDRAGDFNYSVSVNAGYAKNKVLYFDETRAHQTGSGQPVIQQMPGCYTNMTAFSKTRQTSTTTSLITAD
ncbi:hypothetical protein [Mucilaginibacter metallidurans]|uniref:hypothetical protein n=1 Tax=Mucilaginibacter sp. P4 TaxID=3383180 RepID=UPI001AD65EA9|nr:hypothetical protein [Mucilaginibacter gossypii]